MLHTATQERSRATTQVQETALQVSRLAARELDQIIEGTRQLLIAVAGSADVRETSARCDAYLSEVLRRSPAYSNLGVALTDGQVTCSAAPPAQLDNPSGWRWFENTVATRSFTAGAHQVSAGRETLVFASPVIDPDRFRGVAYVALDLGWLNQRMAETQLPSGSALTLFDGTGSVIAQTPDPRRWVGQTVAESTLYQTAVAQRDGASELPGLDGASRFYAYTTVRDDGSAPFRLAVGIPLDEAHAEINRISQASVAGLLIVAFLAIAGAEIIGNQLIVRRMRLLAEAANRLTGGDLRARATVPGADEIAETAQAFNAMADRLASMIVSEQAAKESLSGLVDNLVAQRMRETALLSEMAKILQACDSLDEAFGLIPGLAGPLFPGTAGAVYVINSSRNLLEARSSWGGTVVRQTFAPPDCWALRRGAPQWAEGRPDGLHCRHAGPDLARRSSCVPLIAQGETLGVLHLWTEWADELEMEQSPALVETVSDLIAIALANLRLRETLHTQSVRDPLTGLFNRRFLDETLEREIHRARREQRPLGVVMLDVDHFKKLNDTYGHNAGDDVLRQISALLRNHIRQGDVACRYGGEEFALLLPGAPPEAIERRANELRQDVKRLELGHGGRRLPAVTISLGIAMFPNDASEADQLIWRADEALYRAKQNGRDRVETALKIREIDARRPASL